ncbi:hypothetical protein PR048_002069 [Dryococelus australis]|uniref:DDE-1 domain-containing protein n=1 Tax=Dryococelus australis TaxID=614101 RepID=A0ABQ9IKK2_9NEOP|nr:hypothetical protein PR048_002069 [Dryococelus australis]
MECREKIEAIALEYARKKATDPFKIDGYFKRLKSILDELDLNDKRHQIYNIDDTIYHDESGPGRENVTALLGGNAVGEKLPPLIVFKGKHIWDQWIAPEGFGYPNTSYAATPNGWMETEVFINYFQRTFITYTSNERPNADL